MKPETAATLIDNVKRSNPKANAHLFPTLSESKFAAAKSIDKVVKRIRQSGKPLLNKLESEFLAYKQARYPNDVFHCQAITFKLANGLRFTPDVVSFESGIAWEVKGPHAFDGALDKLKMAAAVYNDFSWILAWKDKAGNWQQQHVLP